MNTDDTRGLLQEIDAYVEDLFSPSDESSKQPCGTPGGPGCPR